MSKEFGIEVSELTLDDTAMDGLTFRDATATVTRVLGRQGDISVIFAGDRAYTDGRTVVLPAIADDVQLTSRQVLVTRGYTNHESLHLLMTDLVATGKIRGQWESEGRRLTSQLGNAMEDVRIEHGGNRLYNGFKRPIMETVEAVCRHVLEETKGNPALVQGLNMLPMAVTLCGRKRMGYQSPAMEKLLGKCEPAVVERADKIAQVCLGLPTGVKGPGLIDVTVSRRASLTVLEYADRFAKEALAEQDRPGLDGPCPDGPLGPVHNNDSNEPEQPEPEQDDGEQPEPEQDDGEQGGDGQTASNEEQDGDAEDEGADTGAGADGPEGEEEEDSGDQGETSEDAPVEDGDDEGDEAEADREDDAAGDEDGEDADTGDADAGDDPEQGDEVAELERALGEAEEEQEDGATVEELEQMVRELGGGGFGPSVSSPEEQQLDPVEVALEGAVTRDLQQVHAGEATERHRPWTTECDLTFDGSLKPDHPMHGVQSKLLDPEGLERYLKHRQEMGGRTHVMRRKLERGLRAFDLRDWESRQRTGSLDVRRRAAGIVVRDETVYRRRIETAEIATAVTMLIDLSGSMSSKSKETVLCTIALAEALDTLVPLEVLGFQYNDLFGKTKEIERSMDWSHERTKAFSRIHASYLFEFKRFDTRLLEARTRIGNLPRMIGGSNADGDALLAAGRRLLARHERRRVMLVLSDGLPAWSIPPSWGSYAQDAYSQQFTRACVEWLGQQGITCVGIGIMSKAVHQFYPRASVLHDVKDLDGVVMSEVARLLLGERFKADNALLGMNRAKTKRMVGS